MNKLVTLLICVAVSLGSQAQGLSKVFSPSFRAAMQLINDNNSTKSKSKAASQGRFDCFIECGDAAIPQLEKAGVRVYAKFDGIVTASVPLSAIDDIAEIGQIRCVDIAKPLSIVSDSAASVTRADMVHEGVGLDYPFTGEGVVLGIVDCGVDFNHPAFYDANNHLRIKAVYLPSVEGDAPVINGNALPGSCYETEYDIAALTTDDSSLTHGTSTTSIAAGTWIGKYGGMAPDADIVVCAMPTSALSNVTVANSALYIADYARRVGKPCVISMSIGNHDGPHDGTGYIARVINGLAQQGPIFVLASGNEGGDAMYLHKVCSGNELNPQLSSVVRQTSGNYRNAVEIWGRTADTIGVQYKIVNISTKAIVYTSDVIKNDTIIRSASNSEWS
ncbi:MAG: S8 family serine peptidase, partial [Muribaculaceae bacterium]|nr:S8 family serine peptidase [Muribaculaceae bacterium]